MSRKPQYIVPIYTGIGVLLGCTLLATSLLADAFVLHAEIPSVTELFRRNPIQGLVATSPLLLGVIFNVIGRIQARLQFTNTLFTTAIETSPDAVLVVDEHARIVSFNRRFVEMWRIPPDILQAGDDAPLLAFVTSSMVDPTAFLARVRYLYAHPEEESHDELETKDGRFIDRHAGGLRAGGTEYHGHVWFFRDITEPKQAQAQLVKSARCDVLTGLANRAVFIEAVQNAIALAKRGGSGFAVLCLDLDHFKDVNDTLGHPIGDELLRAVTERLQANTRTNDVVARFGGDEFAVMVNGGDAPDAAAFVADKVIDALSAPFTIHGNHIHSGASIGIAVSGADGPNAETLLSRADMALYRAKSEAAGGYRFFTEAMDTEVRARVALSADLRVAIATNQIFLVYQPQVDLATGAIIGVEALARWSHPTRGVFGPNLFIPLAERSGLITALGHQVLREACHRTRVWLDAGTAPEVTAVNLSALQFQRSVELQLDIATMLADTGLPPHRLELELTESVLMAASRDHNDVLKRLRQGGIRLAIDDFGVGYSSFDYLRRFPIDRLKIAQEFVSKITTEAGSAAIVRATIGLARELGINLIAEGVERGSRSRTGRCATRGTASIGQNAKSCQSDLPGIYYVSEFVGQRGHRQRIGAEFGCMCPGCPGIELASAAPLGVAARAHAFDFAQHCPFPRCDLAAIEAISGEHASEQFVRIATLADQAGKLISAHPNIGGKRGSLTLVEMGEHLNFSRPFPECPKVPSNPIEERLVVVNLHLLHSTLRLRVAEHDEPAGVLIHVKFGREVGGNRCATSTLAQTKCRPARKQACWHRRRRPNRRPSRRHRAQARARR